LTRRIPQTSDSNEAITAVIYDTEQKNYTVRK